MPHNRKFKDVAIDASNSPFSEAMLEYEFPKKFVIPTFDCFFGESNPLHHLHQYQDKMVIYFRSNPILCWIFPSNLKWVTSDWFCSLPQYSIHGFKNLTKLFIAQYPSRQEFK